MPTLQENILKEEYDLDFFDKYELLTHLGRGSMGSVSKVKIRDRAKGGSAFKDQSVFKQLLRQCIPGIMFTERRKGEVLYALKTISLQRLTKEFVKELKNEISILRSMDHPNIVKAHEVYYERNQIYLILECCDGGDLYTGMPFSERKASKISRQLISAVKYMHDHGIVHRDLKFENIMFENKKPNASIKVIDFGLSKKFFYGEKDVMDASVGTIYTMAPQVINKDYTSQADLWSVGVVVYMLLSSKMPFKNRNRKKMISSILSGNYNMDDPVWDRISHEAKDLVNKLIVVDQEKRLDATIALQHKWLYNENLSDNILQSDFELKRIGDGLSNYRNTSTLKKIALNLIAHKSTSEEIFSLRKAFAVYDNTNDGIITFEEFRDGLKESNYSDETIQQIFESVDVNQNGHIMYTEFLAASLEVHAQIEEERIAEAFDRLDHNNDGFITKSELSRMLGGNSSERMVNDIIVEADYNKDGKIDYQEFLKVFRKQTSSLARKLREMEYEGRNDDGDLELMAMSFGEK